MAFVWNQQKVTTAQENASQNDFSPIPANTLLRVMINKAEDKSTNSGGAQLVFEYEVIEGPFKGRKVWDRHNYNCPSSSKAEEIAWRNIADLTDACWPSANKQPQLHEYEGKVLVIKTKLGKEYNGNIPTEVAKYLSDAAAKAQPAAKPQSSEDTPF
jgi:hypothetical protein